MNNLICLCSSHNPRYVYIKRLLDSYEKQTQRIPLYMSISFDRDGDITKMNKDMIEGYVRRIPDLHIYYSDVALSKFRHYKSLCDRLKNVHNGFVIFSQDDSEWHPNRVETYTTLLGHVHKSSVSHISVNNYYDSSNNRETVNYGRSVEYWQCMIPIKTLRLFCHGIPDLSPDNVYCDCDGYFVKYLFRGSNRIECISKSCYMYKSSVHIKDKSSILNMDTREVLSKHEIDYNAIQKPINISSVSMKGSPIDHSSNILESIVMNDNTYHYMLLSRDINTR